MLVLTAAALAADLCAAITQNVRAAPAAFASVAPLPGASCTGGGAEYSCVFPVHFEDERFPGMWASLNSQLGACRLGTAHTAVSDDPELIYLPSTWNAQEAQVELRVAGAGVGVEVRFVRAPKS